MQTTVDDQNKFFQTAVSECLKQGHLGEAESLCSAFIQKNPKSPEGYFQQSLVTMQKSEWQQTLSLLKKAIQLTPKIAIYHSNTGTALFMLKQYPEATAALEKALSLDPDHINTLNNLGVVYSLQHKNAKAEKLLKHSLELSPNQADTWLNLCSAVQELDFREDDVVGFAQKAVELRPRSPVPYTYLSKALLRQGNPQAALEAIKIALLLDDQNADLHYRKGVCYLELEQIPEAIQALQRALELNPQHGETYHALAEFLYKIEDFPAAEEACRCAFQLPNASIWTQALLAKILFVTGQYQEAQQHYDAQLKAFYALHNIKPVTEKTIVTPVQTVESWSTQTDQLNKVVLPEKIWHSAVPHFYGVIPEWVDYSAVTLPPVYIAEVANAVILPGHEVILVDQEKTALYDRLVIMQDWHSLREDDTIALISNDHILIDICPKAPKKIKTGIFLMTDAWYNYAHWVSEQLPRFLLLEQMPEYDGLPILINEGLYPQQLESIQLITGGRYPVLELDRKKRYEVERLICPSFLGIQHKRRYRPNESATTADGPFHPEAIHFLRDRLLPQCRPQVGGKRRLLISRKQQLKVGQRRLLNQHELEALFLAHGFESVYPETLSFLEQIELFSQAEMIVGPGGAAMMNMIFAPAGAKILMFTKDHPQVNFHYFTNIAQIIGQPIAYVVGEAVKTFGVLGFETDFSVDIKAAEKALHEFFEIP